MRKNNLSRRDFVKLLMTSLGVFLASCMPRPARDSLSTPTPGSTPTPAPASNTPAATPAPTETPTPAPHPTQTPPSTEIPSFRLLTPENGATLPAMGKVTFSWEAMDGVTRYQLQFTLPSGKVVSFDTPNTNSTLYLESFLVDGLYTWQVVAFDGNGQPLCTAAPFTFTKPASVLPTLEKGGGDIGDVGDDDDDQPPPPPPESGTTPGE